MTDGHNNVAVQSRFAESWTSTQIKAYEWVSANREDSNVARARPLVWSAKITSVTMMGITRGIPIVITARGAAAVISVRCVVVTMLEPRRVVCPVFSLNFELIDVHIFINSWKVMDNLLILCKCLAHIFMTDTPKNAKTKCRKLSCCVRWIFFGNLHRLKISPSTVCATNMKTVAFCWNRGANFKMWPDLGRYVFPLGVGTYM